MLKIDKKLIGLNHPPFIIAEMSGNHNQSLKRAIKLVEVAAESGADALKIQTYTADTITLNVKHGDFIINDKESLWHGKSLYELYQEAHTPWEWHEAIINRANELGLICFSSPFDETAVDFLEELNVPAYKIASFESVHLPLIEKVISTGKPIIISTGMTSIEEISTVTNMLKTLNCQNYALLKCTSSYPASPKKSNIITIPHMRKLFNCEIGLSDHTLGIGAAIASIAHGATIIEKHFTIDRSDGGVDSPFSLEPQELKNLVQESKRAWKSIGSVKYGPTESEKSSLIFRRSIYISKDIKKGDRLTKNNIRIVRPGMGLLPKYYTTVLGRRINSNAKKGTALNWNLID